MTTQQRGRTVTDISFRGAPHPLTHWQAGENLIDKMRRSFDRAPRVAQMADVPPFFRRRPRSNRGSSHFSGRGQRLREQLKRVDFSCFATPDARYLA